MSFFKQKWRAVVVSALSLVALALVLLCVSCTDSGRGEFLGKIDSSFNDPIWNSPENECGRLAAQKCTTGWGRYYPDTRECYCDDDPKDDY